MNRSAITKQAGRQSKRGQQGGPAGIRVVAWWDLGSALDEIADSAENAKLRAAADASTIPESFFLRYSLGLRMKRALEEEARGYQHHAGVSACGARAVLPPS